jgi:hypothetical protein
MASIAYQDVFCQVQPPEASTTGTFEPDARLVEAFYPQAKKLIVKGDYLRHKWQPRCGSSFTALIKAIRGHCSYKVKDGEEMCYPSEETLAKECGVTRRTIINWLAREQGCDAACGSCERCKKRGQFCHKRHGEALQQFLRIKPQLRYDPKGHRSVRTSHHYFIRMDDPPVPEDVPLIWAKARELAMQAQERQTQEREREARRQEMEAKAARAASFGPGNCTYNNVKNGPSQQCETVAQDRLSSTSLFNTDFHRSTQGGERAVKAIQSNQVVANHQTNRTKNKEDRSGTASASPSNIASAQRDEDLFRCTASLADEDQEQEDARFQGAWEAAGGIISSLLEEYGDASAVARRDAFKVLRAYLALGAPIERIGPLAYLAKDRVTAFKMRGGRILKTEAGFYVSTVCNLAHEARKKGWDVERIRKADQAKPGQKQEQHRQGTHRTARQAEPRPRRPTAAETEVLVMELGQQPEIYAEAQAQVRQMEERRQARETQEQVVRQQAQIFSRLDQAKQDLQTFPEGSLVWERARREQQELERQIAALRQQGGEAEAAVEGSKQPRGTDRSERECREAILTWAQARGWTVRHGSYGGSKRDWQIGLMAAGRQELVHLAAELGM